MNKRIRKKQTKLHNKYLCERYPFLIPRHIWTDKVMWEVPKSDWRYTPKYSYTLLDSMPQGWRKVFGEQMCKEIREELIKWNYLDKYRISQIKEKYGELRWYDFGVPKNSKIWDIIDKYSEMSQHICLCCGRPAEIISNGGWLEPICNSCLKQQELKNKQWLKKFEKERNVQG